MTPKTVLLIVLACQMVWIADARKPNKDKPVVMPTTRIYVPEKFCKAKQSEENCHSGFRWRFDNSTGHCQLQSVCGFDGPNKFETEEDCLEICQPPEKPVLPQNCLTTGSEQFCLQAKGYAWRFHAKTKQCKLLPVCELHGQNKFSTKHDCLAQCNRFACVSPQNDTEAALCHNLERFVWRYDAAAMLCRREHVCRFYGSNKYVSENACKAACHRDADDDLSLSEEADGAIFAGVLRQHDDKALPHEDIEDIDYSYLEYAKQEGQ